MAGLGRAFPSPVIRAAVRAGRKWGDRVHADLGVDILLTPVMTGIAKSRITTQGFGSSS